MKTIAEKQSENLETVMHNGPGLRYSTNTWIKGRDRKNKKVLAGGYGALGCGSMWGNERPDMAGNPEFENAPEVQWIDESKPRFTITVEGHPSKESANALATELRDICIAHLRAKHPDWKGP